MEELRIDCLHQTEEELGVVKELRQNIFRLNHTMPDTEEYRELLHKVFPHFGENCRIEYDRCRKSSQVNQENIDYGFFGKSHFNKVNFITKSFEPRSKVVAGLSFYLCWQNNNGNGGSGRYRAGLGRSICKSGCNRSIGGHQLAERTSREVGFRRV